MVPEMVFARTAMQQGVLRRDLLPNYGKFSVPCWGAYGRGSGATIDALAEMIPGLPGTWRCRRKVTLRYYCHRETTYTCSTLVIRYLHVGQARHWVIPALMLGPHKSIRH